MTGETLRTERADGVLRLTIARPERMNATDIATMRLLGDALHAAASDPEVRVIVLTGAGSAFCTGADLAAAAASGGQEAAPDEVMAAANRTLMAVIEAPQPVIAHVNGPAAGVGTSLALAADLSYAVDSAYLLLPFTGIGLMPDGGASLLVAAAIGRVRAAKMMLLGERLPAREAAEAGLITAVLSEEEIAEHVDTVAAKLAAGPRRALELTKQAVNAATLAELPAALARESEGQSELLVSPDFLEGMTAMLAHRRPRFGQ